MSFISIPLKGDMLYLWPLSEGALSLRKCSLGYIMLLDKMDGMFYQIDYSLPLPFSTLDERDVKSYCESIYPQLVKLSNSSYRLHMYVRGLGGMLDPRQQQAARDLGIHNAHDYAVASAIQRNLEAAPGNLYTNVQVETCMHQFPLNNRDDVAIPTRHITLTVGNFDTIINFFRKLFTYSLSLNPDEEARDNYQHILNYNAIQETLLGIEHNSEQYEDVVRAFRRNATINLYISADIQSIEIKVTQHLNDGCVIL